MIMYKKNHVLLRDFHLLKIYNKVFKETKDYQIQVLYLNNQKKYHNKVKKQ